jgi:hypothetical protein
MYIGGIHAFSFMSDDGCASADAFLIMCEGCQVIIAEVGEKDSTYGDMLNALPANDCRYAGRRST